MSSRVATARWGGCSCWWNLALKRLLDIVVSGSALLLLFPLLLVIWVAVRLSSPGPGLFRQERLGREEEPFVMLKFRTMRVDCGDEVHRRYVTRLLTESAPEASGSDRLFKLTDDPRVTRVGNLLRRTSLDELPQLWNVFRGTMSLVGPRPVLAWEAELFRDSERRRFAVRPGITGLWQVSGRNRLTMREALLLDVEYVRRCSTALDLAIIVRTIPALLRGGAR